MSRCSALIALISVFLVTPRQVQSQTVREGAVVDTGIAPASWHAALLARRALRDSSRRDEVDVLRALNADLLLGRADRVGFALRHLELTDSSLEGERQLIEARAAYASSQFDQAGNFYAMASTRVSGATRGLLAARAGDAFERAGEMDRALSQYRAAKEELRVIAGWLALREARVSDDSASVLALLDETPAAAHRVVPLVRGEFYARSGDTARAVAILAGAGLDDRAAELALANGDSANARQLAYRSLVAADTIIVNHGVRLAHSLPPRTPQECLLLAGAVRRQSPSEAAGFTAAAVALGDSSPSTLALWGDQLVESGNLPQALTVYRRASAAGDSSAISAEFSRIRVLIRLRSRLRALASLSRFLAAHPEHRLAPAASLLLAELTEEGGRPRQGDSVYRLIVQHWPVNDYASQARLKLAASALRRGDRAEAAQWYLEEDTARGAQQFAARYLLGSLDYHADSLPPESWVRLARDDSLGYYGFLARTRMGVALPAIRLLSAHPLPAQFSDALEQLDLLDRVGFHSEAAVLVGWLVSQAKDADAAPELGEELAARGRSPQGIGLGWRAARRTTMNDARVLRAIYPWPFRAAVTTESREFGLDPYLLAALVRQESSFDANARSRTGARGLMQLMPVTAREAARSMGVEWSDQLLVIPDANLHLGAAHFARLLRRFRGDAALALAAYNAGTVPVERWQRSHVRHEPTLFIEGIPYPETRGYVRSVLRNWSLYRLLYPSIPLLDSSSN